MSESHFSFAGLELVARPDGALFIPAHSTLVVADMHLEKGSEFARRGSFLPPYDSRETLKRIARCIDRLRPARVICLGDSFHDGGGPQRLTATDRAALRELTEDRDWIWVTGNHDSYDDPAATAFLGGRVLSEAAIGPVIFRHEAGTDAGPGEVSGHLHPKASITVRGRRFSGRCFVIDSRRLILPSFGAYTGGLDVFHPAVREVIEPVFRIHLIGRRRVHNVTSAALDRMLPGGGHRMP